MAALLRPSLWWLVLTPLAFFPPIYLLRRFRLGGWLTVFLNILLASLALVIPRGEAFRLLGRPIVYDDLSAYMVALLFGATAILYILSLYIPQGWTFYPFSLIILALATLALASNHMGIIALLVEIAALLSIFVIQGGRLGSVRAPLRFISIMSLAVPLFLLAAWRTDLYRLNVNNAVFLSQVTLLIGLGFALWLGVAPFHSWLSTIAAEAEPGIAAFILIIFPNIAMVNLLHWIARSPWVVDISLAQDILLIAGLFTTLVGGLFASVQRAFAPLMGYAVLIDTGINLIALGIGTPSTVEVIILALMVRTLALVLLALSQASILRYTKDSAFQELRGLARQFPIATLGLTVGALTLAGMPLTLGFVPRWLLLQSLSQADVWLGIALVFGSLGGALGYLRGLRALFDFQPQLNLTVDLQVRILEPLILTLVFVCIGLGLFPKQLIALGAELAQSLALAIF